MEDQNIISIKEAAALYKAITGKRKSQKVLATAINAKPHLGFFCFDPICGRARLKGVRRDRFTYFLKARQAIYGKGYRNIFSPEGLD